MKKRFFIFFCFVFCGLFNASAFGEKLPPFDSAVYDGDCFEGNYDKVKALLEVDKNLVNSLSARYKSGVFTYDVPIFAMVINGCCRRANEKNCGPNRKSDMTRLFIENGADVNSLVGNPLIEKGNTLLDYVRYYKTESGWCPSGSDTTACDEIENLLLTAGAKTYAELYPESSSNNVTTVVTATPDETEVLKTDDAYSKDSVAEKTEEVSVPKTEVPIIKPNDEKQPQEQNSGDEKEQKEVRTKNVAPVPEVEKKSINMYQTQNENRNNVNEDDKDTLKEKQKAYDEAHAKEQSTANKTLTALTTAATGIGGMQLMQGMAEQSADKDATSDMAAYIETMRCTYGDGKQVKAGPEEIELPGANDQEMMNLRAEYLALAADLKERKEALGMKPGIESEVIVDRSATGLYDDENVGITSGNYASLYRAQALDSEADQAKIDDAKKTSANRVKGGAIATGAGVVEGITGDNLINGKLGDLIKGKNSKEK